MGNAVIRSLSDQERSLVSGGDGNNVATGTMPPSTSCSPTPTPVVEGQLRNLDVVKLAFLGLGVSIATGRLIDFIVKKCTANP